MHNKWNEMKPKLEKEAISQESIKLFDNNLNNLTKAINNKKHFELLVKANDLTLNLAFFIDELADKTLAAINTSKYYTRKIVLDMVNENIKIAMKNIPKLKNEIEKINIKLVDKNNKELKTKLISSLNDLENAISFKDFNVVKIKASLLIKNINRAKERLS